MLIFLIYLDIYTYIKKEKIIYKQIKIETNYKKYIRLEFEIKYK